MYRAELRNWGPSLLQIRHCRPILRHEVEEPAHYLLSLRCTKPRAHRKFVILAASRLQYNDRMMTSLLRVSSTDKLVKWTDNACCCRRWRTDRRSNDRRRDAAVFRIIVRGRSAVVLRRYNDRHWL